MTCSHQKPPLDHLEPIGTCPRCQCRHGRIRAYCPVCALAQARRRQRLETVRTVVLPIASLAFSLFAIAATFWARRGARP